MLRKPVIAVALLLVVAGCGGATSTNEIPVNSSSSPLGSGGPPREQCGPDASDSVLTFGAIVLQNQSRSPVVVERVTFYGDHHLRLLDAVIAPDQGLLIGMSYGWPPSRATLASTGIRWNERMPAAGAEIPPGVSLASRRELIIAMLPAAHRSVATGVQVNYRQRQKQYLLRVEFKSVIFIAKSAGKC
jgi:hypothetical protein